MRILKPQIYNTGPYLTLYKMFFDRMDRIKARQQKYKKGKEKMMSMSQESSDGQAIQRVAEEEDDDDDGIIPLIYLVWVFLTRTTIILTSRDMLWFV